MICQLNFLLNINITILFYLTSVLQLKQRYT
jgi:hypothetical protein